MHRQIFCLSIATTLVAMISSPTTVSSFPMNIPSAPSSRIAFTTIEEQVQVNHLSQSNDNDNDNDGTPQTQTHQKKSISNARNQILTLGAIVGQMCSLFLTAPHDKIEDNVTRPSPKDDPFWIEPSVEKERVAHQLGKVLVQMVVISSVCGIDLCTSILKKVELNGRKYPVELCKGKSGKYTNYSEQTGITTTKGQCTINSPTKSASNTNDDDLELEDTTTVEGVTYLIRNFANERLWNRYHTPRNICLALLGEVGELAELLQWKGDFDSEEKGDNDDTTTEHQKLGLSEKELDKIGQEIADVTIYLLRLADVCHVKLGEVAMQRLEEQASS